MESAGTGVFYSLEQEDNFCNNFKALIDEWGTENVKVALPTHWENHVGGYVPNFKVEYSTFNSMIVLVTPPGETRPIIAHEVLLKSDA